MEEQRLIDPNIDPNFDTVLKHSIEIFTAMKAWLDRQVIEAIV